MTAVFERITIIGLGLIGGSIARAARKYQLADIIAGCDSNEIALTYARSHKFIDSAARNPATAVKNSQLVILATPPAAFAAIAREIAPELMPGAIVMDTASVKRAPVETIAAQLPPGAHFIPAHPIAGSEMSGVSAGNAELFKNCRVIVTPDEPKETASLQAITRFWKGMGARIEAMPAELHDKIYGYVSHLPHLLSYAANQVIAARPMTPMLEKFLRLAKSNPDLWSELFYLNQDNLLEALNRYLDAIGHVRSELLQPPEDAHAKPDDTLVRTCLFPRIAASCLVTTVIEAEKKAGISFAKFAGTGFRDFTAPASLPPDEDMERISGNYLMVAGMLCEYQESLRHLYDILASGQQTQLQDAIRQ